MKTVHHYTDEGMYLGSSPAMPSPMEPGVFLCPAWATFVEPPADIEGMVRVWDGSAWQYQDAPQAQADA